MIRGVSEPEPFYLPRDPDKGLYHATYSTTGPWFADAQHAGPPSALLVRAMEQWPQPDPAVPLSLARVTLEVLGPIPAGDVEVRAEVLRPGRRIELLQAAMLADGRLVLQARGWRFAPADTADVVVGTAPTIAGPEDAVLQQARPEGWLPGFMDMIEWRWLTGALGEPGPGRAWVRQRVPLVEGEEPSPLQRLVVAADSANGIAAPLDLRQWLFVNTELSLHLHRGPVGEWTGVDAATVIGPSGVGTVSAVLHDAAGHTGRATQALTVGPR
ncbi:MAG: thioesterase family protein [Pseudonocardia sp.]|uniref:thioesterase family protein n=1 Tax=unclassified Pseudonocardia TaxID=2619320 RepID=UPI00086DD742|nr:MULTISPECIES: thioesterase family protein [unclassified Pseudonocardia]MBN9112578.1 thioesterase family protein [Pseudonocardia sp.]ODV07039.1 MAG: TesB-like acyl-CoA thioesterase 5 [Pseudonocardia sp. SCN 73-27]